MVKRKQSGTSGFEHWLTLSGTSPNGCTPTLAKLPVLVVGSGPGGLAAMAELARAGVAFEAVENHAHVGGIWDDTNPSSPVYDGLQLVTSRFTSYLGPPMPAQWPNYPSREQALEYLRNFAAVEQLLPRIQFSTEFKTASKTAAGSWQATLRRNQTGEVYEREYRAIVVATGAHNKQHCSFPAALQAQAVAGELPVIHSANYRHAEPYAGKRVLVMGIGNSGSDIAERISRVAERTVLSVRTSPWINPQFFAGIPCDKLVHDGSPVPDWLGIAIFLLARRLAIGSNRRLGLSRPNYSLNDRVPVSDRGFVRAIRQGRVLIRSNVAKFEGRTAHFVNGGHPPETLDAVIFATGFVRHYPLLPTEPQPADQLLFHLFHRHEPGLVYMTELVGLRSCWPIFTEQARAIAAYFAAEQRCSERVGQFNARRGLPTPPLKGKLLRLADEYSIDYDIYTRMLREFVQWLSD